MKLSSKGFTLIELLVVISIIGVLTTLVLVSYTGAQKQARDASRRSDLNQYRNALQNYAVSNGGKYPVHPEAYDAKNFCNSGGELEGYLSTCPRDPDQSKTYWYISSPDGLTYTLYADIETGKWLYLSSTGETGKTIEEVAGLPPEKEGFSGSGSGGTTTGRTVTSTPTLTPTPTITSTPTSTPTTRPTSTPGPTATPTPTSAGTTATPTPTSSCQCHPVGFQCFSSSCSSSCPKGTLVTQECIPAGCGPKTFCASYSYMNFCSSQITCPEICSQCFHTHIASCTNQYPYLPYRYFTAGPSSDCSTCFCGFPVSPTPTPIYPFPPSSP